MVQAMRVVTRLQDQDDVNVSLGAGVDADALVWDNASGKFVLATRATEEYVQGLVAGIGTGAAQGTFLVSGGQVLWSTGYTYILAAGTGYIDGVLYSWAQQTVTLDAADGAADRIDVIGVDNTVTVFKITGDAGANPSEPVSDPSTQLKLALVFVATGTSAPTVSSEVVYADYAGAPTEWAWTTAGSGWNVNSSNNPRGGSGKDIEGTNCANNSYAQGERGSGTLDPNAYNYLVLNLRFKAAWNTSRYLQVSLLNAGVRKGNALRLSNGFFGLDGTNLSSYQTIIIPALQFAVPVGTLINQVRVQDVGGSIGFYLDDIAFTASGTTGGGTSGITQEQADARYAQLDHLHTGSDGTGKLTQANTHESADTDSATSAIHHTIGATANTAAAGNHTHTDIPVATVDAKGDLIVGTADNTVGRLAVGTNGQVPVAASGETTGIKWATQTTTINIWLGNGVDEIADGVQGDIVIDFACTLSAWTILADASGAIKIDLWRDTYANFPPTDGDSLTNSHEPEIAASGDKAQDTNLGDWTSVAIVAGDVLRINVDSCTTIKRACLALKVTL